MTTDSNGKPMVPSGSVAVGAPRVFVLSEFRLLRDGVSLALRQRSSVEVVGAGNLSMPAKEIASMRPDVLLLDITLVGSLEASRAIREAMPQTKIVALGAAEVISHLGARPEASLRVLAEENGLAG